MALLTECVNRLPELCHNRTFSNNARGKTILWALSNNVNYSITYESHTKIMYSSYFEAIHKSITYVIFSQISDNLRKRLGNTCRWDRYFHFNVSNFSTLEYLMWSSWCKHDRDIPIIPLPWGFISSFKHPFTS